MGIERDKYRREFEVNDEQDEMADYHRPPPGQEKITGRKPLDEALRIIRHEVINMEQDRTIRKEVMTKLKEQLRSAEEVIAFYADRQNWTFDDCTLDDSCICSTDWEKLEGHPNVKDTGGKRARDYFEKQRKDKNDKG